ncbi:MAG TPA: hypothetical protein VMU54_26505 [Planctomycetota bacterium]|nr:hypothetical protein [Planctomycetota bacterium]
MSLLIVLGAASAFLSGGLVAPRVAKSTLPDWGVVGIGLVVLCGYFLLYWALPFHGKWGEVPLIVVAGAALVWPMTLIFRSQNRADVGQLTSAMRMVFFIPALVLPIFTLTVRLSYADRLTWECDGRIVQHDRSHNHNAPRIVVEGSAGRISFESVDLRFWDQATTGKTLVKKAGSPMAILDGSPIRMLEAVRFRSDPP